MNKTLKISLISVGIIGSAVGLWFIFFKGKGGGGGKDVSDDNIFERVINRLYQNDSFPLKLNSGGDRVKSLQSFLNKEGSYGLDEDGKFGPLTLEALKNQQSPFSDFKMSFPNAVLGEVSEEYYNSFVLNSIGNNSSVAQSSNTNATLNINNIVPTGGGNSGVQYAVGPDEFSFDGNNWN